MNKIAFVFSGQGAQYSGMGLDLAEYSAAAGDVLETAKQLYPGFLDLLNAPEEKLSLTKVAQPCIFVVSLAAARALEEGGVLPDAVAGFSLGEIPALAFSNHLTIKQAFLFTVSRAAYMHKAAAENPGEMFAVLKLSDLTVETLAAKVPGVYPANYNCDGQVVVSCAKKSSAEFQNLVADAGGRCIKLRVSGAFHSPLMEKAKASLQDEFNGFRFSAPRFPAYSNVTAKPYGKPELLFKQLVSPVRWKETVQNLAKDGFNTFVEVGPGKTLCGLIKKILPAAAVYNVEDPTSLEHTLEVLSYAER